MTAASRTAARVLLALAGLAVLALPAVAVVTSGTATIDPLWTALRLASLEGFALILISILAGAWRPLLGRLFRPIAIQRLHRYGGVTGICLVIGHAVMLLVFGTVGYRPAFFWLGPVALGLLLVATATWVVRRGLRRSWRWIHRLNYLVFVVAVLHGANLGTDLQNGSWLRVWMVVCVVLAVLAFVYGAIRIVGKPSSHRHQDT